MTAPALVALAHGSRDPRSAATIKALCAEVRAMRPDLRIEEAFLDLSKPSFDTVVNKLVRAGYDEIVVVPLLLTEAYHAKVDVPRAIEEATAKVRTGPPIDEPEDLDLPIWAGVVPLSMTASTPVPAPELADGIGTPGYVTRYRRET